MTREAKLFNGDVLRFPDDIDDETFLRVVKEQTLKREGAAPETTVEDLVQGGKSAVTTGAAAIPLSIPALAYDLAVAPGHLLYKSVDALNEAIGVPAGFGIEGYEKGFAKRHAELGGGPMGMSARNAELAAQASDLIVDPPKSRGGKIVRAMGSAGIEALGGTGFFKVAGKLFASLPEAQAFLASMVEAPAAQTAYSAAAAGGGEIAQQNDIHPIVGSLLGTAAALGGHVAAQTAAPLAKAGVQAVKTAPADFLLRDEAAKERAVVKQLRKGATDKEGLQAWAARAQAAEDEAARLRADPTASPDAIAAAERAARETHGELVAGSKPTLYEAAGEDLGIGDLQRKAATKNTGGYGFGIEESRAAQNDARVAEFKRLAGTGEPQAILTFFRREREALDAADAAAETGRAQAAATAAERAGTLETPEVIGERVRAPVVQTQEAVTAHGNTLYRAIEDEGVTVGTGRLKAAVAQAYRDLRENPLSGREREIADLVRSYGGRVDFGLLRELRSDLASRIRDKNLSPKEKGRAEVLQSALDRAMDDGLARAVADDPNLFQRVADNLGAPMAEGGPLAMRGRRGAARPKPEMPLSEFIARHGGLPLDAESAARDWGSVRVKGRPLAHPGGRGIDDYWRETLMEEGYIPYDVGPGGELGTARNVDDEIRRLLENELHGGARPDQGALWPLDGPEREMADARALIADRIKREGIDNPSPSALDEAARMMVEGEEKHPTTAYERAVTQAEPPAPSAVAGDIPFEGGPGPGVPGGRVEPPVDQALTEQYRRANRNWAQNVKQPYELAPVERIVERAPTATGFEMTAGQVPEAAFRRGNTGGEHIRALRAAGATDQALADAAALSFQQTVIREGAVDPVKFRNWLDQHRAAIRELPPEVAQRLSSVHTATRLLEEATARRLANMRQFDESAVGKVLGIPLENLQKAIGTYLENPAASNELANRVAGNPQAQAGLRRLVADHILRRFKDASDNLSKASLTTFISRNKGQIEAIFGREGANRFRRLSDDIERSRRQMVTGKDPAGPGTAGDLLRAAGAETTIMTLVAGLAGAPGVAAYGVTKQILGAMRLAGIHGRDELFARALLNPDLARQLLTRAPALRNKKFAKSLGSTILRSAGAAAAGMAYGGNQ
jgi:hypothetical protein